MKAANTEPLLKWPHGETLWQETMAAIWNAYRVRPTGKTASGEFRDWAHEGGEPPTTQEESRRLAPAPAKRSDGPPPNTNRRNSCSGY